VERCRDDELHIVQHSPPAECMHPSRRARSAAHASACVLPTHAVKITGQRCPVRPTEGVVCSVWNPPVIRLDTPRRRVGRILAPTGRRLERFLRRNPPRADPCRGAGHEKILEPPAAGGRRSAADGPVLRPLPSEAPRLYPQWRGRAKAGFDDGFVIDRSLRPIRLPVPV
jgi:hypothetical protein